MNAAMSHPTKMQKVWQATGNSFDSNVAIFKLSTDKPDIYECLGYVAREVKKDGSLEGTFDFKKYACLNKRYLKSGHRKRTLWRSTDDENYKKGHESVFQSKIELMAPGRALGDTSTLDFDYFFRPSDTPKPGIAIPLGYKL